MAVDHIELMLRRGADVAAEAFADGLKAATAGVAGARLALLMPADTLPGLAHASGMDPALPDALVTLPADTGALATLMAAAGAVIDPAGSSLLAMERRGVLPGRDAIRLFFGLRRLAHLSHEGFCDYWWNVHADIGRQLMPPYFYHQLHGDAAESARFAALAGVQPSDLDGAVEAYFPDIPQFITQLQRPDTIDIALEDEKNFIDHARSIFWVYAVA